MATDNTILRCEYIIPQKKRRCGMSRASNTNYCVEHSQGNAEVKDDKERVRVPCPLDPSHTVWKHNLKKHVRICNKAKITQATAAQPYFVKDLNRGPAELVENELNNANLIESVQLLLEALNEYEEPQEQIKKNEFMESNRLIELSNTIKKHAKQQSSLIQNLFDVELIPSGKIMEFGCGRAEFSRYINQTIINNDPYQLQDDLPKYVLIDRGSNRMKFDKKFQDDLMALSKNPEKVKQRIAIDRLKLDIKDLKLSTVIEEHDGCLAISKHLCGVATDLTLRCLQNCIEETNGKFKLQGICIAMCCRHVCNARDYINPDYIISFLESKHSQINYKTFFGHLSKMCSWATSGRRPGMNDDDIVQIEGDNQEQLSISLLQREKIGLFARYLIDNGRLEWVKQNLMNNKMKNAKIIKYIEPDVSRENNALLVY